MNWSEFGRMILGCLLLFIGVHLPVFAYNLKGHAAIERRAYELIKQRPDGVLILNALHQQKVLKEVAAHLHPHTTYPDLSFERQFAQDRQVYHFMSPTGRWCAPPGWPPTWPPNSASC